MTSVKRLRSYRESVAMAEITRSVRRATGRQNIVLIRCDRRAKFAILDVKGSG